MTYFLSPQLSKRLIERGVKSQFDMWWLQKYIPAEVNNKLHDNEKEYTLWKNDGSFQYIELGGKQVPITKIACGDFVPAIHVFDLLLKPNAKIVFGDTQLYQCKECGASMKKDDETCGECGWGDYARPSDKIWQVHTHEILSLLQSNGDWEKYIESTMVNNNNE